MYLDLAKEEWLILENRIEEIINQRQMFSPETPQIEYFAQRIVGLLR